MYVKWKTLLSMGLACWSLLYYTDLLGESGWKRCSYQIEDIIQEHVTSLRKSKKEPEFEATKQKLDWPGLLWNVFAFLCSLVFCSIIRSMLWVAWTLARAYNIFTKTKANKLIGTHSSKILDSNCTVIFKNETFATVNPQELLQELTETKKEKEKLAQQVIEAQKEHLTARQEIEEYKLETILIKEQLSRATSTLKENLQNKSNQEFAAEKVQSLELHLEEVCRDRDSLRSKLDLLEESQFRLETEEQYPERDTAPLHPEIGSNLDMHKFQKKIIELQKTIGTYEEQKFGSSIELEDTAEDSRSKIDINVMKQNILNFNAYRAQMLKPRMKLANIQENQFQNPLEIESSSDDNNSSQRIISSTVEFQNFLKTLASNHSYHVRSSFDSCVDTLSK